MTGRARPFYLNLLQIRLPIGGWVSILHRGSGVLLSLAVPGLLYVFMLSLESSAGFAAVTEMLGGGIGFLILLGLVWAGLHHFLAGLRHLGFDLGWGEEKLAARRSAWAVLLLALLLTGLAFLGVGHA
jgi:succinate dehydrogenase / fumarate reductase cytochrome b subunit